MNNINYETSKYSLEPMLVYAFDEHTKEYIGSEFADIDVFSGKVLLPANTTDVKPIELRTGYSIVFTGGKWVEKIDNRGKSYYLPDGTFYTITELGDKIPNNALVEKPDTRSIDEIKLDTVTSITNKHAELLRVLTGNATIEERDTWQTKAIAAEAFNNNSASNSQKLMLQSEADILAVEVSILVQTILQKYENYQKLIGLASGLRSKGKKLVEACSTKEEVKTVMEQLEQEVNTYISQLNG